jgi:hypothetical protein
MTSPARILALANATRWIAWQRIEGAFVECGVWRGGSMMVVAQMLQKKGDNTRDLYLFDTFDGMTEPTDVDQDFRGRSARPKFQRMRRGSNSSDWCRAPLSEVKANMARTGYPSRRLHYQVGPVEETLPDLAPERIALLRLDTDWYTSTRHELIHLWPRLVPGGICIIDDYGYWGGSRKAVDEFFGDDVLMHRIDFTGRLVVKPDHGQA